MNTQRLRLSGANALRVFLSLIVVLAIANKRARCQETTSDPGQPEWLVQRDELDERAIDALVKGDWAVAVKTARHAVELERQVFGNKHSEVIDSMSEMAIVVLDEEGVNAARKITTEWLALAEAVHGQEDWRTEDARRTLALIEKVAALEAGERAELRELDKQSFTLYLQEKHWRAIKATQKLVSRLQAVVGSNDFAIASCYERIATCHAALEDYDKAESLAEQVLQIRREVLGLDHPETASVLVDMAWLSQQRADRERAAELYQQAFKILKPQLGIEHEDYLGVLGDLAGIYVDGHRDGQTIEILKEAAAAYKRLDDDESLTAVSSTLAKALKGKRQYREALPHFQVAAECYSRIGNHVQAAWMWDWTGACYRDLKDHEASAKSYAEAARRFNEIGHDKGWALNTHNLAVQLLMQGIHNYDEAINKEEAAMEALHRLFASDHPTLVESSIAFADSLAAVGRTKEARERLEELLGTLDEDNKGDHPQKLTIHRSLAAILMLEGNVEECVKLSEQSAAMARRLHTGDHEDVVRQLRTLAQTQYWSAAHEDSCETYGKALAVNRRLHPDDHPMTAKIRRSLGMSLAAVGRSTEALEQFQIALDMMRRLGGDRNTEIADTMKSMARCLSSLGRDSEAMAVYQSAMSIANDLYKGDNLIAATHLIDFARNLNAQAKHQQAAEYFKRGLAMLQRLNAESEIIAALGTCGYASSLRALGNLDDAIETFERAIELIREAFQGDSTYLGFVFHEYGLCLSAAGRYQDAIKAYQTSLGIRQRTGDVNVYRTAANLGWELLNRVGQPEKAAAMFELSIAEAESARLRVGGEDLDRAQFFAHTEDKFDMFLGMMRTQLALNRPDQALAYLERGRARTLLDLLDRGRRIAGGDILQPVQRRAELMENQRLLNDVLRARTNLLEANTDVARLTVKLQQTRARPQLDKATRQAEIEGLHESLVDAQSRHRRVLRAVFNLAGEHASNDFKSLRTNEIQTLLRGNQRMLVYSIGGNRSHVFVVSPASNPIRAIELSWPIAKPPTARMPEKGILIQQIVEGSPADVAGIKPLDVILSYDGRTLRPQELTAATSELDGVARRISVRIWRNGKELTLQMPSGQLGAYIAMQSPDRWQEKAEASRRVTSKSLAAVVSKYVRLMQIEGQRRGVQREDKPPIQGNVGLLGFSLFKALIPEGIWSELQSADVVYIVPDGALNRLPFESLIVESWQTGDEASRRYWLDEGPALAYGPSATVLVNRRKARDEQLLRRSTGSLPSSLVVALGNPIFQRSPDVPAAIPETGCLAVVTRSGYVSRYGGLRPLPATEKEVLAIRKSFEKENRVLPVITLLGEDATRTQLIAHAGGTRYLHLATHGLVDETEKVCWSSLALTVPIVPTPEDFGFLTLNDLFQNWWGKLSATELVVLSACDSQRGRLAGNEGVFGMPWGFMYAGTPAVIGSLWPVDDESTAGLMSNLYSEIQKITPENAIDSEAAKLRAFVAVRKALRARYPQPYFWAPFIYSGDPR